MDQEWSLCDCAGGGLFTVKKSSLDLGIPLVFRRPKVRCDIAARTVAHQACLSAVSSMNLHSDVSTGTQASLQIVASTGELLYCDKEGDLGTVRCAVLDNTTTWIFSQEDQTVKNVAFPQMVLLVQEASGNSGAKKPADRNLLVSLHTDTGEALAEDGTAWLSCDCGRGAISYVATFTLVVEDRQRARL